VLRFYSLVHRRRLSDLLKSSLALSIRGFEGRVILTLTIRPRDGWGWVGLGAPSQPGRRGLAWQARKPNGLGSRPRRVDKDAIKHVKDALTRCMSAIPWYLLTSHLHTETSHQPHQFLSLARKRCPLPNDVNGYGMLTEYCYAHCFNFLPRS
jgi:hypothetical protein